MRPLRLRLSSTVPLKLLPYPRSLTRHPGVYLLPAHAALYLEPSLPRETALLPIAERLQSAARTAGAELELITGPKNHPRLAICALPDNGAPNRADGYTLIISRQRANIGYHDEGGLRAAAATLRQLLREY